MASIAAIQEKERQKKEERRLAVARQSKLEEEIRAAQNAKKQRRVELHASILRAIADGREDDAIKLVTGDIETDSELLCTPDHAEATVLHRAAACGLLDCCMAILSSKNFNEDNIHVILGAKDKDGCTAMHMAARMDNASVCEYLLDVKSDAGALDKRGWTARDYAHSWGLFEPSAVLAEATLAVQLQKQAEARQRAAEEEARRLAAIRPPDLKSRHALLEALPEKRLDDCFTVLEDQQWLYTNEKDSRGRNALHLAAEKGHANICRALLARPDFRTSGAKDKDLSTALHYAVGNRWVEASLAIIESPNFKAIDAVNLRDQTALTLAAQRGDVVVCKAILERTTPEALRIEDRTGLCALDYAEENEMFDIISAIQAALGQ